jgi:transcriptional regulator with XRE-family HTH domain
MNAATTKKNMTSKILKTKDSPDDRDRLIGLSVKAYREINGLSQTELGEKVGVTFQQIQKYESGKNKVSVSRLIDMCKILQTPLMIFLSGLADAQSAPVIAVSDVKQSKIIEDPDRNKEITELLKVYNSVESEEDRAEIMNVLKALAAAKKKRTS